jgi:hypothetical protein
MNIKTLCATLLCIAASSLHAEEAPLFRMTSPAGYVFQEVERGDNASTVEAVEASGSVAAKSMFLLRGSCALMKERDRQAFRIERLSKQPIRFIVRFVAAEPPGAEPMGKAMDENSVISSAFCNRLESIFTR